MVPPVELMTYDDVTEVYRKEQRSKNVTEVRRDFYPAMRDCLERLRRENEKEISIDPFSPKAMSLSNQMKKISEKAMQIYEFRMEKMLLMALRASGGAKVDTSKLTDEEKRLFDQVSISLRESRSFLSEGERKEAKPVERETPPPALEERPRVEVVAEPAPLPQEPTIVVKAPDLPAAEVKVTDKISTEYVLLRILEDIPPFAGPDRNYALHKEDMVTLPAAIAKALVNKKKAVPIQASDKQTRFLS